MKCVESEVKFARKNEEDVKKSLYLPEVTL